MTWEKFLLNWHVEVCPFSSPAVRCPRRDGAQLVEQSPARDLGWLSFVFPHVTWCFQQTPCQVSEDEFPEWGLRVTGCVCLDSD